MKVETVPRIINTLIKLDNQNVWVALQLQITCIERHLTEIWENFSKKHAKASIGSCHIKSCYKSKTQKQSASEQLKTIKKWNNLIPAIFLKISQICEPVTYKMRVITFYSDSATAVSPAGPSMVGSKGT